MPPFTVIIPARHASTRLPGKPLIDLGGKPMIVRVAEQAARSGARSVVVATDHAGVADAVRAHGFDCRMTRAEHASGTDRSAEVAAQLGLDADGIVVNVQGDEPLIAPELIGSVAALLAADSVAVMATACHPIADTADLFDPNVVKVALDARGHALYFSRAPIPYARDAFAREPATLPARLPAYRHIGLYAYRVGFLTRYTRLEQPAIEQFEALEQLRVLWHGFRISVAVTEQAPTAGVDTPEDAARVRAWFEARR